MARAVDTAAPQHTGEHCLAAEHIKRQIAVMIVIGVKLALLLLPVQGDVRCVHIENELARAPPLGGDELLDQHPIECHHIATPGTRLQPRQCRAAAKFALRAHRGLHQRIAAQSRVIVEVFVAAGKPIEALGHQSANRVDDALRIARIVQCLGHCRGQPQPLIDLAQQHQPAVRAQRPALEVGLDHPSAHASKIQLICGTLWHRHSPPRNLLRKLILCGFKGCADLFLVKYPG
jgi:hypothetical protein